MTEMKDEIPVPQQSEGGWDDDTRSVKDWRLDGYTFKWDFERVILTLRLKDDTRSDHLDRFHFRPDQLVDLADQILRRYRPTPADRALTLMEQISNYMKSTLDKTDK